MRFSHLIKHAKLQPIFMAVSMAMIISLGMLAMVTLWSLQETPKTLNFADHINKARFLDRHGETLNITYDNQWNIHDTLAYHKIPSFLREAMVFSEDKRFFRHHGVDWLARFSALWQNSIHGHSRGASTITEQVIKMLHPRPRTPWTRWLEGFEAKRLEKRFSKVEILEFYLNQVSYAARRRGVKQAASYYFDRDLNTLNHAEMLALSVILRAPKWFDPRRYKKNLRRVMHNLAKRMYHHDKLSTELYHSLKQETLDISETKHNINAEHFIAYIKDQSAFWPPQDGRRFIHTTLDAQLQNKVQQALDNQLQHLSKAHVQNGAVLVVDHHSNEILAWVVAYAGNKDKVFNDINAVNVPRQPGSALKPFLYARAMEMGWSAATMLSDTPLEEGVGVGLHRYHNYSGQHYGMVSLREALGNSLNIPAIRAIQFVGSENFLELLYKSGIVSLAAHPNVYGDGIALGNGELSLYELVQAYTSLARMGNYQALSFLSEQSDTNPKRNIINTEVASLIADILSDPRAREKEFGANSILNFTQQTAIKTGTSSDYRDAWAVGYNDRYTVGAWFGNLDYSSMNKITGSKGPAWVLRTVFNELNRGRQVRALYLSEQLEKRRVCMHTGEPANKQCGGRDEWFLKGQKITHSEPANKAIRMRKPTNGLRIAMDPRIPDRYEVFEFEINAPENIRHIEWLVNGKAIGKSKKPRFHWQIRRGRFQAQAKVYLDSKSEPILTKTVSYYVK